MFRLAAIVVLLAAGCSTIDDLDSQRWTGSRQYAERTCRDNVGEISPAYETCVSEKARRRLALYACMNPPNAWFFAEDVCAEAE